jgi:hypothetical protein
MDIGSSIAKLNKYVVLFFIICNATNDSLTEHLYCTKADYSSSVI